MSKFRIIAASELTTDQTEQWKSIAAQPRYLNSPFFQPEFTQAVAAIRDDAEVALLEEAGDLIGLFPFQRTKNGLVRNICSRLSEFHGPIVRDGSEFDLPKMLNAADLKWWQFDHLPMAGTLATKHVWGTSRSPYIDLSNGYDAYIADRKAAKASTVAQTLRKTRKMEREVGPLRFQYHSDCTDAFESLIKWKDAQHKRTGRLRVLQYEWLVELLRSLTATDSSNQLGLFSTLHAGEKLVAVHLGLRTNSVVHLWFPSYDRDFEKYSPGLILLLNLLQAGAEQGVQRFDFGKGKERYKASFKTGDIPIGEGAVDQRLIMGPLRKRWYEAKQWARQSRFERQFDLPFEMTRALRQKLAFD